MISSQETSPVTIRDLRPGDEPEWRRLWGGYVAFYEADVSEAVTANTWRRLLAGDDGMFGRIADCDGSIVGFSASVLHAGTWTLAPVCYLEDLFVDPAARGRGIGAALIGDLIKLARERGWSRLYWHTRASNSPARRLYDRFANADDFVRYRLFFE
jgi:GNAT superfamily N-acetyltransferase